MKNRSDDSGDGKYYFRSGFSGVRGCPLLRIWFLASEGARFYGHRLPLTGSRSDIRSLSEERKVRFSLHALACGYEKSL
jgi:hypothetical protein